MYICAIYNFSQRKQDWKSTPRHSRTLAPLLWTLGLKNIKTLYLKLTCTVQYREASVWFQVVGNKLRSSYPATFWVSYAALYQKFMWLRPSEHNWAIPYYTSVRIRNSLFRIERERNYGAFWIKRQNGVDVVYVKAKYANDSAISHQVRYSSTTLDSGLFFWRQNISRHLLMLVKYGKADRGR